MTKLWMLAALPMLAQAAPLSAHPVAVAASPIEASGDEILPHRLTDPSGIHILFADPAHREAAASILAETVRATGRLEGWLEEAGTPTDIPPFPVRLGNERRVPTASRGALYLPVARIGELDGWQTDPMSIQHEIVHLLGSGRRPDRLIVEGLAVHLADRLGKPTYPNHGEDLDRLLVALEAESGTRIPLLQSEQHRKAAQTGVLRRQAYVQEGSFVRWLLARQGLERLVAEMMDERAWDADDTDWGALEAEWRASLPGTSDAR
ncbi:hypothetical protein [Sphingomicrobium aestuariivivum]|uniref:hypothetical protein n=1 Tax=Sphingomicrobium aestuariivivum TaxID=1582356 RepID=UPI001FD67308|nr:hypothetical protein [Sphingomicrobium aestuariivivum]MCJ8191483.1 hypothetical protein [Sphingomicrobium aestuariivivum]